MADKKKKNPSFITPKGSLKYPALTKPDYGTKDYPKPDGQWKADIILDAEPAQELIEKLQPIYDAALAAGREEFAKLPVAKRKQMGDIKEQPFYTEEYDKETEEPTGRIIFNFRSVYSGVSKKDGKQWTRKIDLFDAKGKKLVKVPDIWGGSQAKVQFEVAPYFIGGTALTGIKFYLNAVQIIELRSGGGRDADSYGFGAEDGFEAGEDDEQDDNDNPPFQADDSGNGETPDF